MTLDTDYKKEIVRLFPFFKSNQSLIGTWWVDC